ncbi:uncharacterized protein BDZ99DRAFT_524145 [Mytilinidion resinicola]|uniref:Uncharacterized protein n=1 Tax=Mytilinidion resinicola TaxID=574789 RepID=A0A6A6YB20_9PEZI|nr:uncharacterized protein BDZ99DRAFT_524145 [Mytilinidion resinicola]KAF2805900.1 hypothetical protein BDZ99DRAFT_524145 [Mytilinidion resinicola]
MANQSKATLVRDRVTPKLHIAHQIWEVVARASFGQRIVQVETTTPEELRAVWAVAEGQYGCPLPEELSREDQLAFISYSTCDEVSYIFLELLKHLLGEDIESISWWRIRPKQSRKVWIGMEDDEEEELYDHSHLRVQLVDGTVLIPDFTGYQHGWPFEVVEAEEYYQERCEEGTESWEVPADDQEHQEYSYAAQLRKVMVEAVDLMRRKVFDEAIELPKEESKDISDMLEMVREEVRDFCARWGEHMMRGVLHRPGGPSAG